MLLRSTKYLSQIDNAHIDAVADLHDDNSIRIVPYPAVIPYRIELQDPDDAGRQALESFVHSTFKRVYGADVRHFLPRLMSLTNRQDELIAAVGFHAAQNDTLFLEQYLDKPIEEAMSAVLRTDFDVPTRPIIFWKCCKTSGSCIKASGSISPFKISSNPSLV